MLGQLEEAARSAVPDYAVCVVSDHGFSGIDHSLNLMKAFAGEGSARHGLVVCVAIETGIAVDQLERVGGAHRLALCREARW